MSENPRKRLERFRKGVDILSGEIPDTIKCMFDFIHTAQKEGKLSVREKELIAIGVSLYHRCEDCIAVHVYNAFQAGCTRQDIMEAAEIAMVFGGGPTLAAAATLLTEALDEFENDFSEKTV